MSEWKTIKFSDFITLQRGFDLTKNQIVEGEYPVVCSTSIMGYHNAYKCMGPGVVTGRSGTIGQVQYIEGNYWPHNTSLYVKDFKENDVKFVYYFLMHFNPAKAQTGAAVPTLNRNNLGILDVTIPDLATQRRISSILSQYDSMIENCRCQIKLLEEAAQRTYREWFVEMRFPGHENVRMEDGLPEGWKRGKANDYYDITIGRTPPRTEKDCFTEDINAFPWVSITDMKSGTFVFSTEERLTKESVGKYNVIVVPENTVLLSFKLTVGRVSITTEKTCTNEAIAHFYIKNSNMREYTFMYLKNFEYDTLGNTSAISKAVNSTIIKNMPFVVPDEKLLNDFSQILKPIFDTIYNKSKQIRFLQQSRDLMLPRLMRGEEC